MRKVGGGHEHQRQDEIKVAAQGHPFTSLTGREISQRDAEIHGLIAAQVAVNGGGEPACLYGLNQADEGEACISGQKTLGQQEA